MSGLTKRGLSRRDFLRRAPAAGALGTVPFLAACGSSSAARVGREVPELVYPFQHGIASGDPSSSEITLWTRVTLPAEFTSQDVSVVIHDGLNGTEDDLGGTVVTGGTTTTNTERDFTVKMDFSGLSPYTTYYYQFTAVAGGQTFKSAIGRFKTFPAADTAPADGRLRIGIVSCSSFAHGYFHAYTDLAQRQDLDVIVHLGDYIYEYGTGEYGTVREYEPPHEMVTLDDYRTRHALYKRDPELQKLHQQYAFITTWDDHEFTDNTYRCDANNHNAPEEGEWTDRWPRALQAYDEWMPLRYPTSTVDDSYRERIYRSFDMGSLAKMMILDTRFVGRDIEPANMNDTARAEAAIGPGEVDCTLATQTDNPHNLLGPTQRDWLSAELNASTSRWNLLGQQIMVGQLAVSNTGVPGSPITYLNFDQWDGYQSARDWLWDEMEASTIDVGGVDSKNCVVLTGDIHTSWVMDITREPGGAVAAVGGNLGPAGDLFGGLTGSGTYNRTTGAGSIGAEFVCTSVTSEGLPGQLDQLNNASGFLETMNPHMKYEDLGRKGYMVLDVRQNYVQGQFFYVGNDTTIAETTYTLEDGPAYRAVNNGDGDLYVEVDPKTGADLEQPRDAADLDPFAPEFVMPS